MHITAIEAMSLNGFITDGDDPDVTKWTSTEDKAYFKAQKDSHNLIVMGKGTYEGVKKFIIPSPGVLRVILVKNPEDYANEAIEGQLEFMNLPLKDLITHLESRGFDRMLLAGGSQVYSSFMNERLINELRVTVEPELFMSGTPLFSTLSSNANLKLKSYEKLNDRGTLLLCYELND